MGYFLQGALSFANILIAVFVLFFAISFLRKTRETKDRNPWIFLFVAVVVFFSIQVLKVLELLGHITLDDYMFYLDSMFIAIVLFTFIFQYNLILNSELIQIRRKRNSTDITDLESDLHAVERIEKKLKAEEKDLLIEEKELEKYTHLAERSADKIKSKTRVSTRSIRKK